jgi:hypothetical protein
MKLAKTFRLSEEAVDILNKQENQSKYIEDLIMGGGYSAGLTEARVIELIKEYGAMPQSTEKQYSSLPVTNIPNITTGNTFVPKPPDPEYGYPCCKGRSPCKHWTWDEITSLWTNTLTGATRSENSL